MLSRFLLVAALFVSVPSAVRATDAAEAREAVVAAADAYAAELMAEPPADLTKGEVGLAFGWIFLHDMLGKTSLEKAVGYLEIALDNGVPEAGVVLGAIFMGNEDAGGHERDVPRALAYYHKAADGGSVDALRMLGILYEEGAEGLEADPARARGYLREAARRGSETAIGMLEPHLGTDGLPATADELPVEELVLEARERSGRVATATARVFDLLKERLAELELSIREGNDLGIADMSNEERMELWRKLEETTRDGSWEVVNSQPDDRKKGDAALIMGIFHHIGLFHGVDLNQAEEFMEYALAKGIPEAKVTLGELYLGVAVPGEDDVNRDVEKGLELLRQAVGEGTVDAMRLLGMVYDEGVDGVEADKEKAREYFLMAARHGDEEALERLGDDAPEGIVDEALAAKVRARNEELSGMAEVVNGEMERRLTEVLDAHMKR